MEANFSDKIDIHHQELIKKAINIVEKLNIPIVNSCFFDITTGTTRLGYCQNKNKIYVHLGLNDEDYVNTCIHELLHTVDNNGFTAHQGNWKKWADVVSNNTKYKMTISSDAPLNKAFIKTRKSNFNIPVKSYCPICNKEEIIYYKKEPSNNFTGKACEKCNKPLLVHLSTNPVSNLNKDEIKNYICSLDIKAMTLDELSNLLPYIPNLLEGKLIVNYLKNHLFNEDIKEEIRSYARADQKIMKLLSDCYCNGDFDNSFIDEKSIYEFENIFALTDYWRVNAIHTKNICFKLHI